jgi:hypothetical protein
VSAFEMGDGSSASTLSRLAPAPLVHPHRDTCRFLHLALAVKFWIDQPPDVHAARPPTTPCCGTASAPPGGPLLLHGHGTRERGVRGVLDHDGTPSIHQPLLRRYISTCCGVTCTVGPVDVLPYKRFGAVSIALALGFYGVRRESLQAVRARLNPIPQQGFDDDGWRAARRWIATVAALFTDVRAAPGDWTLRQVAERAAMTVASRVPAVLASVDELPAVIALAACRSP